MDDWMKSPLAAMRTPLPGQELDTLGEMTTPQMPDEPEALVEPESTFTSPLEAIAAQLAERAVQEKALSQRTQQAVAQRNAEELRKAS